MNISSRIEIVEKHPLGCKLAVAGFFFSLIVGVITTMLLLLLNYSHYRSDIEKMLENVHLATERTLVTALQISDDSVAEAVVQGLVAMPGIEQVTLRKNGGSSISRGATVSRRTIEHTHPLVRDYHEAQVPLGIITVIAGLDDAANSVVLDGLSMAAPILLLAFCGCVLLFFLFHLQVVIPLEKIAAYAATMSLDLLDAPLSLRRKSRNGKPDELDRIVSALNVMRNSVIDSLAHLRARDAKYKAIVSSSSDVIVTIDNRHRLTYANPAGCRYLEQPLDKVVEKDLRELGFSEDVRAALEVAVDHVLAESAQKEVFFDMHSENGKRAFAMLFTPNEVLHGQAVSVVGIARDITQQQKSEAILRKTFQHLPMIMTVSDLETGRFIEVNDRFVQSLGRTRDQVVGATTLDLGFISKEDRHCLKTTILSQGYVENMELHPLLADGSRITIMCSGEIITLHGSKAILLVGQDITEQKKALQEQEKLERQLQQAMKMEAVGRLAGGIAHDFNNILSAILGYAQLALEQTEAESTLHHDLRQVIQAGMRASALVKQILAFSRQDQEKFRPLRLQPLIQEVAKLLRSTLPTTINLYLHIDEKCGAIMADAVQLHQVLMNLCTNARQAIGNEYGEINIALSQALLAEPLYSVDKVPLKQGIYLHLTISDTGAGMSPEIMTRIFDPFFTTKEKDQGTGLGLSVTHGIVAKHQGAITVTSAPDAGTAFHVYLPLAESTAEKNDEGAAEQLYGQEHILLVDDEPLLVDLLERSLCNLGYRVTSFTSSLEALNFFLSYPQEIDVLVTDMTMPGMTGLAISQEMRRSRPDLQIILCSGYSEAIDEDTARRENINRFLHKPVLCNDIARAIRSL